MSIMNPHGSNFNTGDRVTITDDCMIKLYGLVKERGPMQWGTAGEIKFNPKKGRYETFVEWDQGQSCWWPCTELMPLE